MRRICFVKGRREDEKILRRNLPLYRDFFEEVVILCPYGKQPHVWGITAHECGGDAHSGEITANRVMNGMIYAAGKDYDQYVFLEYDAVLLKEPPAFEGMQCNKFWDGNEKRWGVDYYLHYPWIFSKGAMIKLKEVLSVEPVCEGYADRWIAPQIKKAGIEVRNLLDSGDGYSYNTIEKQHEGSFAMALEKGVWAIHGVKRDEVIDMCYEYKNRSDLF